MIVTHMSPDLDAIGYVWLMRRFGSAGDMPVAFVNTGSPDPAVLASAWSVGDTGRVYDPDTRRFDHHQFPGRASNETCATRQAYEWLCATQGATLELTLGCGGRSCGARWPSFARMRCYAMSSATIARRRAAPTNGPRLRCCTRTGRGGKTMSEHDPLPELRPVRLQGRAYYAELRRILAEEEAEMRRTINAWKAECGGITPVPS